MHVFDDDIVSKQDFDEMQHDKYYKYELIDGIVFVSQKKKLNEKNVIIKLATEISIYLKNKPYNVFSDIEIEIADDIYCLDLCVINNMYDLNTNRLKAVPIIIADIITQDKTLFEIIDIVYKFKEAGVKEYWLINIKTKSVYILTFDEKINFEFFQNEQIKSKILVDLQTSTDDIM